MISRVSVWAASYFDYGQAIWIAADQGSGIYAAWKSEAAVDRSTEILGLKNYRKYVKALPDDALEAAKAALKILDVPERLLSIYLYRLLVKVGGWSSYAACLDWESELNGGKDGKLMEFLTVLMCWEACLFQSLEQPKLKKQWSDAKKAYLEKPIETKVNQQLIQNLLLQEAFNLSAQREIIEKFQKAESKTPKKNTQLKAQAIFCIDVRSEVYRRNLEVVDNGIETIGFAGFFAFSINFVALAHEQGEAQCPVLIQTGPTILETAGDEKTNRLAIKSRKDNFQLRHLWKTFRSGAISCFSFVSPHGIILFAQAFYRFIWFKPAGASSRPRRFKRQVFKK